MRPPPPNINTEAPRFSGVSTFKRITLQLKVTTAYYGGGVEAGASDPLVPYRPSAIRGMLRWFWRATRGGKFADFQTLKQTEDQIWGSTDRASRIEIDIANGQLGRPVVARRRENDRNVFEQPQYALFPAQSDVARAIHRGGSFELQIRFPMNDMGELADEVDAALRYWISFGGVGARTRRGLGSVYCPDYTGLNPADFLGDGANRGWSTLKGGRIVMGPKPMTHEEAWLASIRVLQEFRQQRFRDRGRSRWPEPDAIRRIRGQRASHHDQDMTHDDIYPRAALGLPIIFHFKTPGDPQPDNTLVIDGKTDRFASPVVAKPLAVSATHSVPILLAYNTPAPPKLLLTRKGGPDVDVSLGNLDVIGSLLQRAAQAWSTTVYAL